MVLDQQLVQADCAQLILLIHDRRLLDLKRLVVSRRAYLESRGRLNSLCSGVLFIIIYKLMLDLDQGPVVSLDLSVRYVLMGKELGDVPKRHVTDVDQ